MKGRIYLLTILIAFGILASCKKDINDPGQIAAIQVQIDSADVVSFTNIRLSASYEATGRSTNFRFGICWSKKSNPTAFNDTIFQPGKASSRLDTVIRSLDSNTTYHLRAFCINAKDTIYSTDKAIKTGGLSILFDRQFVENSVITIKQVLSEAGNGFIVLSQIDGLYTGYVWSRLTRVDTSGNILWKVDYDVNQYKFPDVVMAEADGYVVSAHLLAPATSVAVLYKTDLNGTLLWEKQFVDSTWSTQLPAQLYQDSSSAIVLTTRARMYQGASGTYVLGPLLEYRVDQNGNLLDTRQYPTIMSLSSPAVITTAISGNGYLALFYADSLVGSLIGVNDFRVQKFSPSNILEWDRTFYAGIHDQFPYACLEDNNGNYAILAATSAQGSTPQSSWLFGIDKDNGNILWQNIYGNTQFAANYLTEPSSFTLSPQNNYYVTGSVIAKPFILKTGYQGKFFWDFVFNNPAGVAAQGSAIFAYPNNVIYLFGTATMSPSQYDNMFLIKLKEY